MKRLDVYSELVSLVAALQQEGVEYALCGALALAVYGVPRATKDIDVLAREQDIDRIKAVAGRCGFVFEALPITFGSGVTVRRYTKLVEGRPLMLDVLVVGDALRAIWESRRKVSWREGELQVVSRDGLITLKTTAGRPQDLVDLQQLAEAGEVEEDSD